MQKAVKSGVIATTPADPKGIEIRKKVEGAMIKLGQKWRKKDFTALRSDPGIQLLMRPPGVSNATPV